MRAGGDRRSLQEASIVGAAVTAFAALLLVLLPAPAAAADLSTRTVLNFTVVVNSEHELPVVTTARDRLAKK